jgi:AMP-polyphosphate phosphotransferase
MLEKVNLKLSLSKAECQRRLPQLQNRVYDLEHAIYQAGIPVVIVFEGWAAAGKGSTIRILAERMDPRGFRVVPITTPRTAELQYPWLWRFWQKIPAYGQIIVFDTSWYRRVLIDRVAKNVRKHGWQAAFQDIAEFEEQLAADGTVILKFWLHISKREQTRRFKKVLKDKMTTWQVSNEDSAQHKAYKKYLVAVEEMLVRTDAPHAPWTIVEATDRHFCRVKVIETIIHALEVRLGDKAPPAAKPRVKGGAKSLPPALKPEGAAVS